MGSDNMPPVSSSIPLRHVTAFGVLASAVATVTVPNDPKGQIDANASMGS